MQKVLFLTGWLFLLGGSILTDQAHTVAGTVDPGFEAAPGVGGVEWLAVQSDRSIVVLTNTFSPFASNLPLLRLIENGQRDTSYRSPILPYAAGFEIDWSNRVIYAERPASTQVRGVGRLLEDGIPDPSFNSEAGVMGGGTVETILELPGGSILIGGLFNQVNGQPRQSLARLTAAGELAPDFDLTFNGANASVWIYALARQPDGKILVGGTFTNVDGRARGGVARLNTDGTVDESFVPAGAGPSSSAIVYAVAIQSDDKILVGGPFSRWGNEAIGQLVRLDENGSVDPTFTTTNRLLVVSGSTPAPERILVQEDQKIVISGRFSFVHGQPRSGLARLLPDGELDADFNVEIRNQQGQPITYLPTMDFAPENKLVIGGVFTQVNGVARTNIARILLSEPGLEIRIEMLKVSPTEVNIQFDASAGGEFLLESSSDLITWNTVGEAFQVSAPGSHEVSVPNSSVDAQFFRVRSAGTSSSDGAM